MGVKVAAFACDNSGVGWYRIRSPARALARAGAEVRSLEDNFLPPQPVCPDDAPVAVKARCKRSSRAYDELAAWGDVLWTNRYVDMLTGALYHAFAWGNGLPWVMDLDDNVFAVRPSNPVFGRYKRRGADELFDVKEVESADKADRANLVMRRDDGKLVEVTLKDEDTRRVCERGIIEADALIVSVPPLKRLYHKLRKREHGKDTRIYVCPNSLDPVLWDSPPRPLGHEGIRVGWAGGSSHKEDLDIIAPIVEWMLETFPQTHFVWLNFPHRKLLQLSMKYPGRCVLYQGWAAPEQWYDYYTALDFDIALAPLKSVKFNTYKSNLKWLEAAIKGQPAICSAVTPYLCVRSFEDGILCGDVHEWRASLRKLIENPRLREDIGAAARARVLDEFNMRKNVHQWRQVFEDVVEKCGDRARERMEHAPVPRRAEPHLVGDTRPARCAAGA